MPDCRPTMPPTSRKRCSELSSRRSTTIGGTAGRNSFRGWLWGITRHKLADYRRRLQRETPGQGGTTAHRRLEQLLAEEQPPGEEQQPVSWEDPLVRRAWHIIQDEFTPPTQQAFWQTVVVGRAPAEVADDLGITANAVYLAKSRVLARLREELEGFLD